MQKNLYQQIIWDYDLSQKDFQAILDGNKKMGSLDQSWAIARVLEHVDYYAAKDLVSVSTLSRNWPSVKSKIFNQSIKDGYEFLLHRYALSSAR